MKTEALVHAQATCYAEILGHAMSEKHTKNSLRFTVATQFIK